MHRVHGGAQHYAWGDDSAIPEMVGQVADGRPWAEWWMGTHPLLHELVHRHSVTAAGLGAFDRYVHDLAQRQLRYAAYAWQPPAQGGERRADDEDNQEG